MTEQEILKLERVTVAEAAAYLGVTPEFIRCGMQDGRLPIGTAVLKKQWIYDIRPKALVAYKNGENIVPLTFLQSLAANIVDEMITRKAIE